jgi:hypothetical protein
MPFTSVTGRSARARLQGLHRAAFWRVQGFPNLALARAARAAKRQQALAQAARAAKRQQALAQAEQKEYRRYAERLANQINTNLQALLRR